MRNTPLVGSQESEVGSLRTGSKPYPLSRTLLKVIAPVFGQFGNSRSFLMDNLVFHP